MNSKSRFRYRLNKLYKTGFFVRCKAADRANVELRPRDIHEGEAEGLTQAQENDARFFLVDEKRAREFAELLNLTPIGTVGLLARLHLQGYSDGPRALVRKLRRDLGYHLAEALVEEAIAKAKQPI